MSTHVLTITYQQPAAPVDPYWVRIQQEDLADQTATVADAAALLDALYRIEPCADGQSTPELVSDLAEAVAETEILAYCGQEQDGSVEVELDVIRSHLAEPYRLRLQGGEVVKTVEVAERVTVRMEIGATVTLDYPVVSGFACDPEPLARVGNTLSFAADHVGRGLTATYLSRWDRVTVKVLGVDGKAGSCRALAFHHGLVADVELQVPDADEVDRLLCPATRWEIDWGNQEVTCYQDVTVIRQCNCSETEVDRYTYQQVVPCPNPEMRCPGAESRCMHLVGSKAVTEWVECQGDNAIPGRPGATYAVSSPEYYRRMCCQDPPWSLPQCEVKHTTYQGELDIQPGRQYWRDLYGDHARFVPVPPPGGICGEWIIRQVIGGTNCCEGVPVLVWDTSVSPEVMSPNSAVIIGVTGGVPFSLTWEVSGHGFQFQNGSTKITSGPTQQRIRLSALPIACGSAVITVSDGCSTATGFIRSTSGRWLRDYDLTDTCPVSGEVAVATGIDRDFVLTLVSGQYKIEQTWGYTRATTGGSTPRTCEQMYADRSVANAGFIAPIRSPFDCIFPDREPNELYPAVFRDYFKSCTIAPPYYNYVLDAVWPKSDLNGDTIRVYRWVC